MFSQASRDFTTINFVKLGKNGFTNKSKQMFNGKCINEHPLIFKCKHRVESYIIRDYNTDLKEKINYIKDIQISIKVNENLSYVSSYIYFISISQIQIITNTQDIDNTFLEYNLNNRISVYELVAIDKKNHYSLWKSEKGFGYSWINDNNIFFEACTEKRDCLNLFKKRKLIFRSESLRCGYKYEDYCISNFENEYLKLNLFEILWFKFFD